MEKEIGVTIWAEEETSLLYPINPLSRAVWEEGNWDEIRRENSGVGCLFVPGQRHTNSATVATNVHPNSQPCLAVLYPAKTSSGRALFANLLKRDGITPSCLSVTKPWTQNEGIGWRLAYSLELGSRGVTHERTSTGLLVTVPLFHEQDSGTNDGSA